MKIITWNVNGIRAVERKGELQTLINHESPDILLLQEIKGNRDQFSKYLRESPDYEQYFHSAEKKGYAGTGLWIRRQMLNTLKDVQFHTDVPQMPNADEGRVSWLSFSHRDQCYDILGIYFPNGGKSPEAWRDKLVFFDRIHDHMNHLRKNGSHVIVGGDMNVAHTEIDIARPKENDGRIGFHPDERAWMDRMLADNWIDVWRSCNPGVTEVYSYWDTITRARERNVGWRIDYFIMTVSLLDKVEEISYLGKQMGSDHCPLRMELATV